MNRTTAVEFEKLNSPIFQKEASRDRKKVPNSKSELNSHPGRITKDEFLRELSQTLSVLANR